jgi:DNA repair exonuclease SbcCD ATPase subunit
MRLSAQVRSIQALEDLKGALGRFGCEAQMALQAAEQEIRRTLDWLQERLNYWRSEVQRRQEEVRQARADLASCRASGYYEDDRYHAPDCSAEEHALRQAQVRLHEAEEELQNVQRWMKAVSEAVDTYRVQAQRLGRLIVTDLPKANAFLERKIAELQAYLAVTAPTMGMGALPATAPSWPAEGVARNIVGDNEAVQKLSDGLATLQSSESGHAIARTICERATTMRFGQMDKGVAYFDRTKNEIVINERLRDRSPNVLAAHLGHEGTHVQWNRANSIDQEYHAFKAEAEVWNELKGSEMDEQCDHVSEMISLGKAEAKKMIRRAPPYRSLPEYA